MRAKSTAPGSVLSPLAWALSIATLGVAAAFAIGASSCASYGSGGGDGGVNPAGSPIHIGASMGLTGGLSGQVRALKGALAAAQNQINAGGGILNRQVVFDVEDDGSDPAVAQKTVKSLLADSPVGILGPGASSEVQAVYPTIAKANVIEMSATATSILLTMGYPAKKG